MPLDQLALERAGSDVSSETLSRLLYGGGARLSRLRAIWERVENDSSFDKSIRPHLNHAQRYIDACRKVRRFSEIVAEARRAANRELVLDELYELYLGVDENLPLDVHLSMFIPIMQLHTDAEQRGRWLTKSLSFEIIGAYCQTELAHGSNVRGIETVATFIESEDAFDLHSPTLTSTKWWPGGLGKTCTHAVVYANLVVGEKNHGPHPFMVQIRSGSDHAPCEGVTVGDIGPKLGYNSMDNGFARFSHVKVPRKDMLRGFAKVSRKGAYSQAPGAAKVAYGIMLDVRCRIVANSAYVLARALTIALRYSCVRLQGGGKIERAVIEYPTQQNILLPLLALAFALHFTGEKVRRQYDAYVSSPDLTLLPDLHCTTASLKALVTARVSDGMEASRKACGGHGFLLNAGFGELMTSYLPFCTLEGTREVLGQQGGRHLLKIFSSKKSEISNSDNTAYLLGEIPDLSAAFSRLLAGWFSITSTSTQSQPLESQVLVSVFEARARYVVQEAATAAERTGTVSEAALLDAGVEIVAASEAHAELLLLSGFAEGLRCSEQELAPGETPLPGPTLEVLKILLRLFAQSLMAQNFGQFAAAGLLQPSQLSALGASLLASCKSIRPHAVALVEGWAFSDRRLGSTLGRADGKYAEALYEQALSEPLNATDDGFKKHLQYVVFANSRL